MLCFLILWGLLATIPQSCVNFGSRLAVPAGAAVLVHPCGHMQRCKTSLVHLKAPGEDDPASGQKDACVLLFSPPTRACCILLWLAQLNHSLSVGFLGSFLALASQRAELF